MEKSISNTMSISSTDKMYDQLSTDKIDWFILKYSGVRRIYIIHAKKCTEINEYKIEYSTIITGFN